MVEEELVYLIAESIFDDLRDCKVVTAVGDFEHLSYSDKQIYSSMAHNIIAIFDDYYDEELLDDDLDDDDLDDDYEAPLVRLYEDI